MMLLLLPLALAGETALYQSAYKIIEVNYLRPALVDPQRMFLSVGEHLEDRIEWLLVDSGSDMSGAASLTLTDGAGKWTQTIVLRGDLPAALSQIEDAVRAAGLPLDPEFNLPVEILRGMVKPLDKHSVVLSGDSLERFDQRLSGKLSGIGATITVRDNKVVVKALNPDSPALRGGLQVGDVLLRIGGVSTVGMDVNDAVDRIRGPEKTKVTLTIDRQGQVMELVFERVALTIPNVRASVGPHEVGVLTIENFSEQTEAYLRSGLAELQAKGVLQNGLIIDLRGNTGGSLIQSAKAVDAFVNSGVIVTTTGRDGRPLPGLIAKIEAKPEDNGWNMPIAVLMDHDTASGSEILAGALARLDRAILVGSNSFGKGTVQKVYQIDPEVKLKLTVAEYLVRGSERLANVGLSPDVALSPVRFGPDGVWWADPTRERARLAPGTPLLHVAEESPGWRTSGMAPPERDAALELTAALVAAADGPDRPEALDSALLLARKLALAEDAVLVETFGARGIDWSPRLPGLPAPEPRVRLSLPPVEAAAGATVDLTAAVHNDGPDLHRAALRLRSVNGLWDDRVLPIGRLRSGEVAHATTRVPVPWTVATRTDRVEVLLEAQDLPGTPVGEALLATTGAPPPPLAVALKTTTEEGVLRVALTLESRGATPLQGVSARFRFPDVDGVELVEGGTEPVDLAGWARAERDLHLRLAPSAPATVPVSLVVSATGYGRVQEWEVALPRSGAQRLEAPTVVVRPSAHVQAPGLATLSIRATDDRALDHVVVLGGPETADRSRWEPAVEWTPSKLAWKPSLGRRAELAVPVEVAPGANRFVVVAEDRTGLRTTHTVYLLGDSTAAVAAAESEE